MSLAIEVQNRRDAVSTTGDSVRTPGSMGKADVACRQGEQRENNHQAMDQMSDCVTEHELMKHLVKI